MCISFLIPDHTNICTPGFEDGMNPYAKWQIPCAEFSPPPRRHKWQDSRVMRTGRKHLNIDVMLLTIHTVSEVLALLNGIKRYAVMCTSSHRAGTHVLQEKPKYCSTRPPGSRQDKCTKSTNMMLITIGVTGGGTSVLKSNFNINTVQSFIFVVPCIVILGWRHPTRCNSLQIFIYC